jgi:hypothetical protein
MSDIPIKSGAKDLTNANWLEIVRQQVDSLKYGLVEIVVHDSQVTQIEKTERLRLDKPAGEKRSHRNDQSI